MQLLVDTFIKTDKLDKDDLEISIYKVVLKGLHGDVKIQVVATTSDLTQLKETFPIERGMAFELEV